MKSKRLYSVIEGGSLWDIVTKVNNSKEMSSIVQVFHEPGRGAWRSYSAVVELEPSDEMLRKEIAEMLYSTMNRPEVVPVNIDREIEKHPEGCSICTEKDCACHLTTVLPPE
jgi:hypothetical protein